VHCLGPNDILDKVFVSDKSLYVWSAIRFKSGYPKGERCIYIEGAGKTFVLYGYVLISVKFSDKTGVVLITKHTDKFMNFMVYKGEWIKVEATFTKILDYGITGDGQHWWCIGETFSKFMVKIDDKIRYAKEVLGYQVQDSGIKVEIIDIFGRKEVIKESW
jgi:hypothetical protein